MDELTKSQLIEYAQQFFSIANAITAFTVIQAIALMYAFKDTKLVAAFLRWRPYTSILYRYAGSGYILAVITCGIAEFSLRYTVRQHPVFLGACVLAVVLRCAAIHLIGSVHCQIFVAVCREQNWLNKNRKDRDLNSARFTRAFQQRAAFAQAGNEG
jgi:hypothetical protein